ncbi:hypothetical protein MMC18_008948 [Xylographa bjoerkii]|nr:hypothetical protein [Xylographa bjoerkii]
MSGFHYTTISFPSPYQEGTDHPQGYILIKNFKPPQVTLVYSPDDQKLYVRKIIRHNPYAPNDPPEIRYSNLGAEYSFPLLPFLPVAIESACIDDSGVWGLILEAYNGGTQENFIETYGKHKRPVPESFVWHFIEQTARAYAYLHFGHIDGKKVGEKDWVPIMHRDGAGNNIFLHFPDPGKKAKKSDKFIDSFPRVVLGDLGLTNRLDDTEDQNSRGCFDQDVINQWEDVALFGEQVRHMLYTSTDVEVGGDIDTFPRLRDADLEDIYSKDLIAALEPFECPNPYGWDEDNAKFLPEMRYVAETLLPQAIRKVQEYKQRGGYDSVRWAQPQETSLKPYVVDPNDKKGIRPLFGLEHVGDWVPEFDAVDFRFGAGDMEFVKLEASDYPECLTEGFDLTIPPKAFDDLDSLIATAFYANDILKESVTRAATAETESSVKDPEQVKDIMLVKAALKVLRPVHHESGSGDSSSEGSSSSSANDDSANDDASAAGSSSHDDDPQGRSDRMSKSRSKSRSPSRGADPKGKSKSRSRSVEVEDMANLKLKGKGKKRKREVSVIDTTRGKRVKGVPRIRETITTTTTRESF